MSAVTLVLAVIIVILLYLLLKKYTSEPSKKSSTSEIGTSTETSALKDSNAEKSASVRAKNERTSDDMSARSKDPGKKPGSDVKTAQHPIEPKKPSTREMGTNTMRNVPPWKLEGEAYYPPNFWIDSKRR
ncbi:hypothetical protein Tcan_13020 [Toxocara canis]|uniref:Uncharacterized protein n=1 Tax=Toxocara canis TaxID=6265 RepID=A0A0B2V1C6_TOXCA|nr:hypothetical protein Tcan_13020 [Toxocara canis]